MDERRDEEEQQPTTAPEAAGIEPPPVAATWLTPEPAPEPEPEPEPEVAFGHESVPGPVDMAESVDSAPAEPAAWPGEVPAEEPVAFDDVAGEPTVAVAAVPGVDAASALFAGAGGGYDDDFVEADAEDEDDGEDGGAKKKKKRVPTSTKIVLVLAAWVFLTLFLVGRFSSGTAKPSQARLDAGAAADAEDGSSDNESAGGDGESDADGTIDAYRAGGSGGTASGDCTGADCSTGSDGSGTSGTATGGNATGGSGGSTGGSTGGGTGGGTGGTGTGTGGGTTTPVKGQPPATTTKPTTTSPPTTGGGGGGSTTTTQAPVTVNITGSNLMYNYPTGYTKNFSVPKGSKVRFDNTETSSNIDHTFTIAGVNDGDSGNLDKGDSPWLSPALNTTGTFDYSCKHHPTMNGSITVT